MSNLYSEIKAYKRRKRRLWIAIILAVVFLGVYKMTSNEWAILPAMAWAFVALRRFEDWQRKYA